MNFAADYYAEGICNSTPGSSIETLIDTIEATIDELRAYRQEPSVNDDAPDHSDALGDLESRWEELRDAINTREKELTE